MGKGYSRDAMVEMLHKAQAEMEIRCVYWCVSRNNIRALRFYDKNGYERVSISDYQTIYDRLIRGNEYSAEEIDNYVWYVYER